MTDSYRKLAGDLLDYLNTCNVHHAVPLRWDLNHYTERLHEIEKEAKHEALHHRPGDGLSGR